MAENTYLGLLAILFAIFIFGMIFGTDPMKLLVILAIGALVFLLMTIKDTTVIMGLVVLIFALLFYLMYPIQGVAQFHFSASEDYFGGVLLILIVIVGFVLAYKATGK